MSIQFILGALFGMLLTACIAIAIEVTGAMMMGAFEIYSNDHLVDVVERGLRKGYWDKAYSRIEKKAEESN